MSTHQFHGIARLTSIHTDQTPESLITKSFI